MKFYFNLRELSNIEPEGTYFTMEEIRNVKLYEEGSPELAKLEELEYLEDRNDICMWPVHSAYGLSTQPVECKDIDEAYEYLLEAENVSIYECIHDI